MSLGDFFPEELKQNFAERNVDIGQAILIEIPDFNITHSKYVILVSKNEVKLLLAYVLINTEINDNVFPSEYLKSLHVKIDKKRHTFLSYDSWVNCSEIKEIESLKVIKLLKDKPERVLGNVHIDILKKIHSTITIAKTINAATKKKFGFL
jgi:hypothetical protein